MFGRRPVTAVSAVNSHDAMAGMQRRVSLPRDVPIKQADSDSLTSPMPHPLPTPTMKHHPSQSRPDEEGTSTSSPEQEAPTERPGASPGRHEGATDPSRSAPPRVVPRRQPRILRSKPLSLNPNAVGYVNPSSETHSSTSLKSADTHASPLDLISAAEQTFIPSSKASTRRAGTRSNSLLETYSATRAQTQVHATQPPLTSSPRVTQPVSDRDGPLPPLPGPRSDKDPGRPHVISNLSSSATLEERTDESKASFSSSEADSVVTIMPKKRPSWASNWGKSASSSSQADPARAVKNIITGESLETIGSGILGAKSAGRGGLGKLSSSSNAPGSSGAAVSSIQIVLRDGNWELEGHELHIKGFEQSVPGLQSRLLGGVKAEQVG